MVSVRQAARHARSWGVLASQPSLMSHCTALLRLLLQLKARLAAKKKAADAKKKSIAAVAAAEAKARAKKAGANKDKSKYNQAPTR